ncbi:MAG: class I SAM-dependent methyltransferase [Desulfobacteraceae bacterium]|nr:class I SAM-dependent methyltransferase [Desulfobacteraceae bacterium]
MEEAESVFKNNMEQNSPLSSADAFSRLDDSNDSRFYKTDRFVSHLDSLALSTVQHVIGRLIIEENPVILDLMAGWDSHIPNDLKGSYIVGLGLNENELKRNKKLTRYVLHDLNQDPHLPFPDGTFDVVMNTVSVDYMTLPIDVFKEVGRILKPGGLFLVIFSNRMFPQKAVKVWRDSDENERVILVNDFFDRSGAFEKTSRFASKGKPRPKDDKYAGATLVSDPIYAVYAEKKGGTPNHRKRPVINESYGETMDREILEQRKAKVKETFRCPHCNEKLNKWEVPDNPFCQTWDNEFMHICFNDACPYFVRGWDKMYRETNQGMSYRLMYNPEKDYCIPIPVPSHQALKDGIIE